MREITYVEPVYDDDGYQTEGGYKSWPCDAPCNKTVYSYGGGRDVSCECGASYNAFGQRLADNWYENRSCRNDDISDLDGYEEACLRREMNDW